MKILSLAILLGSTAASAAQVWTAPAAQKIRPQTPAGSASTAKLSAAQNEFESVHVVVTGQASGVSMSLASLDDGRGNVISGRDVVLYREALIEVKRPSGQDGATGQWPDALVPDVDPIAGEKRNAFPFDVPEGESRAVLIDLHVPEAAPAGTYRGTVQVSGGVVAQVPIELTVWDFAIPSTSTLRSSFGLSWNGPCLGNGDAGCANWKDEEALRARYVQAALDNRISISSPALAVPVDGDGTADWTEYDLYAGPFIEGTAPTRLAGAKLTSVQLVAKGTQAALGAWAKHFHEKGWFASLFDYACDEPPLTCAWKDLPARLLASHAADPQLQTLVTTTAAHARENGIEGIDLLAPVINFMDDKAGTQLAGSQRAQYPGTVWWYQSCMSFGCQGVGGEYGASAEQTGWPSYAIDTDGTRNRAMEWLSFTYAISGELYYETAEAFAGDAWIDQGAFGGAGDGTLFYPGTPARIGGTTSIPIESLRMKGIRDGMEDHELLALAARLGLGAQALQIAQGVYPKTYLATTSPAAIDAARAELAGLILHALGKGRAPPVTDSRPAPAAAAPAPHALPAGGCSTSSTGGGSASLFGAFAAAFASLRARRRKRSHGLRRC